MGIDQEPFWTKLYLYGYEGDFISNLSKKNKSRAIRFKNISLFIDNKYNLYDSGEFSKSFHAIYPNELQLKCEHHGLQGPFLDLDINVAADIDEYKLYDKRDKRSFRAVFIPHLGGNTPAYVICGSALSKSFRIAKCAIKFPEFFPKLNI